MIFFSHKIYAILNVLSLFYIHTHNNFVYHLWIMVCMIRKFYFVISDITQINIVGIYEDYGGALTAYSWQDLAP